MFCEIFKLYSYLWTTLYVAALYVADRKNKAVMNFCE